MSEVSETTQNRILEETAIVEVPKEFHEIVNELTTQYVELINQVQEKFKYSNDLAGALEAGNRKFVERVDENYDQILYTLADNFLFCLEEVHEQNADFFAYQVDKVKRKNGKTDKLKVSCLVGKAQMKSLMKQSDEKTKRFIFDSLNAMFKKLLIEDEETGGVVFHPEFIEFVKKNLNQSKNYSKMLVAIDNVDSIMDESGQLVPTFEDNDVSLSSSDDDEQDKKKGKKGKKQSGGGGGLFEDQFMKGLEGTKIAQLAQNISSKIKAEDFPELNDPTKLLSSLTSTLGGGGQGGGDSMAGFGNLLKFVVDEVHGAMNQDGMSEADLANEASNMMNSFKGLTGGGFDPFQMLKTMSEVMPPNGGGSGNGNGQMPDMSQLSSIFEGLNGNLEKELKKTVDESKKQSKK